LGKKGRCVYCGFVGELTDEHALPTWIAGLLPDGGRFETITTKDDGALVRNFETIEALGVTAHVVCAGCNNGWMEQLETRVRPHLVPMIMGEPITLDADAMRVLARWTAKTHQMYRYHLDRPPAAPALRAVHSGTVPRATFLLAASWRGQEGAYVVHNSRTQLIRRILVPGEPRKDQIFYSELLTLRIGYVALQTFEITPYADTDWQIPYAAAEVEYIRAIWPPRLDALQWPPPKHLDDEKFGGFDYRTRWVGSPTLPH
jgi:hypothetical protein